MGNGFKNMFCKILKRFSATKTTSNFILLMNNVDQILSDLKVKFAFYIRLYSQVI